MGLAVEQFDLSSYDLVISSSHTVAKGVITGPDQLHVSYVHSPMRYVWDLQPRYLDSFGWKRGAKGAAARVLFHYLRLWDSRTAAGVDDYIANSAFIARRVEKAYGRRATVIYPSVDTERFTPGGQKGDFYLTSASRNPFKETALVVDAFRHTPERRLVVTGEASDMERIRALAGPNVELLGHVPTDRLVDLMREAKAFVFAAAEDFGIVMAEAQACGTPVVAFGRGGAAEIVRSVPRPESARMRPPPRQRTDGPDHDTRPTGVLFDEQTVPSLLVALERFERDEDAITSEACRASALRFSADRFRKRFTSHVEATWTRWLSDSWSR
jgi:glycosyltransferase involved in cell wall biosynthesis